MGQIYRAVCQNHDGELFVYNCTVFFKEGTYFSMAKLTEHSWLSNPFVNAICMELSKENMRVAWIGDYCEEDCEWYSEAWDNEGMSVDETEFTLDNQFLINHTSREYIDCNRYRDANTVNDMCIHPLPLLTACGNGLGSGDYRHGTNLDKVGSWAYGEISVEAKAPEGYTDITDNVGFIEDAT